MGSGSTAKNETPSPAFEHVYAAVNSVRLHYVAAGNGKLIVFLHGFPEFWYAWKAQLAEFGRDHRAVAPDMRGYNLSSKPAEVEQYQTHCLVEDVRALVEHLGDKRFILVGHDWGGGVAWRLALAHPEYLEKLIIINAPHPAVFRRELRENPAQQAAGQYRLLLESPEAEAVLSANNYARLIEAVLADGLDQGYFTEADRAAYIEARSQPGALTGALNYYRATPIPPPAQTGAETAASDPASVVRVPTLVIWGEKDTRLLTGNLDGLEAFVPELSVKRIPDGSHWVVHERPALVNALIRAFVADTP